MIDIVLVVDIDLLQKIFMVTKPLKGSKVLIGFCSICNRKKSMTVSDNTVQAEGLGDFFKNLGKKRLNVSKKMTKNVLSNPTRALDITANFATAAVSRNPKNVTKHYLN